METRREKESKVKESEKLSGDFSRRRFFFRRPKIVLGPKIARQRGFIFFAERGPLPC